MWAWYYYRSVDGSYFAARTFRADWARPRAWPAMIDWFTGTRAVGLRSSGRPDGTPSQKRNLLFFQPELFYFAMMLNMRFSLLLLLPGLLMAAGLAPTDLLRLQSVDGVALSPDGLRVAYTVNKQDGPLRPYSQLFIRTLANGTTVALSSGTDKSGNPVWSPDSKIGRASCRERV